MMDRERIRTMRLVCKDWQKIVEDSIGVKVKVDDSINGNLEFVKRVKAVSARVVNWTEEIVAEPATHLFQHPDWLKKLKLCGKMPAQWKIHNLSQFPNLAHLVLRDKALYLNNITGHHYPLINFDPTSQLPIEQVLVEAFESQDPPLERQPIELRSLRTLEIVRNYERNFDGPQTHGYLVILVNICFILNNVMSPLLSVLHVSVCLPEEIQSSLKKLNWTFVPLHRFLDNHRKTLRQVLLPRSLKSTDLFQIDHLSKLFPTNLQKMKIWINGPWHDVAQREALLESTFSYLEKCIEGQTQLQDVNFHFSLFSVKWTQDVLTSLANSCGHTLKYLQLQGFSDGWAGTLDLQVLSVCHSLEVLEMPSWGEIIINVDKLPVSLKVLAITEGDEGPGDVGIENPHIFKRFTALEWLSLEDIRLPILSNEGNQGPKRQFCRTMIKDLVGLRQLQGFHLAIGEPLGLNRDVSIVKMLSPLDPSINPAKRHPQIRVSFNLDWRWIDYDRNEEMPPWSDNRFNTTKWDLEKWRDDDGEDDGVEEPLRTAIVPQQENADDGNDDLVDDLDDVDHMDVDDEDVSSDEDEF